LRGQLLIGILRHAESGKKQTEQNEDRVLFHQCSTAKIRQCPAFIDINPKNDFFFASLKGLKNKA
jgi:hypothetical protein